MAKSNMPSDSAIRAALREKFGPRGYKIDNQSGMHGKTDTGWKFLGYTTDSQHLALTLNIGPLALTASDFLA